MAPLDRSKELKPLDIETLHPLIDISYYSDFAEVRRDAAAAHRVGGGRRPRAGASRAAADAQERLVERAHLRLLDGGRGVGDGRRSADGDRSPWAPDAGACARLQLL